MADQLLSNVKLEPESDDEAGTPSTDTATAIDFYNCLINLIPYLDLNGLLTVADTCQRLKSAAADHFGNKYGDKRIKLLLSAAGSGKILGINTPIDSLSIDVVGAVCLPFLRCFGAKISKLDVWYRYDNTNDDEQNRQLDHRINGYCANSLVEFDMRAFWRSFIVENFPNRFPNVTTFTIFGFHLDANLSRLVYLFPNLVKLDLRNVTCENSDAATKVPVRNLMHLLLWIRESDSDFTPGMFSNLLAANPQLTRLSVTTEMALREVFGAINANPSITTLGLHGMPMNYAVSADELTQLANRLPSLVEFHIDSFLTVDNAIMVTRLLPALKLFWFFIDNRSQYQSACNQLDNTWIRTLAAIGDKIHFLLIRRE